VKPGGTQRSPFLGPRAMPKISEHPRKTIVENNGDHFTKIDTLCTLDPKLD
jgi:hypothetical protein